MEKDSLNIRQLKFIDNLFKGMTQTKAYTEAGYESKTPDVKASRLVRNGKVVNEIKKRLDDINIGNRIRLGRISETALAKLLTIIQSEDVDFKTKLDAIKDALDRAGLKPIEERKLKVEGEIIITDAKRKLVNKIAGIVKRTGEDEIPE